MSNEKQRFEYDSEEGFFCDKGVELTQTDVLSLLNALESTNAQLRGELEAMKQHAERGERWRQLMALKKPDAIGEAFALLEESVLHHIIERAGWTPDDTCYMETTQKARALIEAQLEAKDTRIAALEAALLTSQLPSSYLAACGSRDPHFGHLYPAFTRGKSIDRWCSGLGDETYDRYRDALTPVAQEGE